MLFDGSYFNNSNLKVKSKILLGIKYVIRTDLMFQ